MAPNETRGHRRTKGKTVRKIPKISGSSRVLEAGGGHYAFFRFLNFRQVLYENRRNIECKEAGTGRRKEDQR